MDVLVAGLIFSSVGAKSGHLQGGVGWMENWWRDVLSEVSGWRRLASTCLELLMPIDPESLLLGRVNDIYARVTSAAPPRCSPDRRRRSTSLARLSRCRWSIRPTGHARRCFRNGTQLCAEDDDANIIRVITLRRLMNVDVVRQTRRARSPRRRDVAFALASACASSSIDDGVLFRRKTNGPRRATSRRIAAGTTVAGPIKQRPWSVDRGRVEWDRPPWGGQTDSLIWQLHRIWRMYVYLGPHRSLAACTKRRRRQNWNQRRRAQMRIIHQTR